MKLRPLHSALRAGLVAASLALVAAFDFDGNASAQGAPVQWNYIFQPNGQAQAIYPGDVLIQGNCFVGAQICGGVNQTVPNTWTATQTFSGSPTTLGLIAPNIGEPMAAGTAPATTQNVDALSQSVYLFSSNATANWTLNFRGNGSTALNLVMAVNQCLTFAVITTQGASPFFNNAVTIDGTGTGVTTKWQGGAPIAGNANGEDVYSYTICKTASATYNVLASQIQFK